MFIDALILIKFYTDDHIVHCEGLGLGAVVHALFLGR